MHCTQIRNATLRLDYGGQRFLIDPMLADQGAFPGFAGTMHSETANPTVPLPVPLEQLFDVDAVLVTHTHPDHWDEAARTLLPRTYPCSPRTSGMRPRSGSPASMMCACSASVRILPVSP